MKESFISNIDLYEGSSFLERPRLHKLLKKAMEFPVVTIYGASGYGKTQALYSFLKDYDAYSTWIQLTELDNDGKHFWESYANMVSRTWPEAGERLLEIGFPEKEDNFARLVAMMQEASSYPGKHVMVYDDFHLVQNSVVFRFLDKVMHNLTPNATVVLISRTMPHVNMAKMEFGDKVFTINENDLAFSKEEITNYFKQLSIPTPTQDIHNIYADTRGWAVAINLIGRWLSIGDGQNKYKRKYAREAMIENIHTLFNAELLPIRGSPLWRFLLRASLVDRLAPGFLKSFENGDVRVDEMSSLHAFIRYDSRLGRFLFHHMFLDFLRLHQHELTDEEKRETYEKAAQWSDENNCHIAALSYYEMSGNYPMIAVKIVEYNIQIAPDIAEHAIEIFARAPKSATFNTPMFHTMFIKLKIAMGQIEEAMNMAEHYVKVQEAIPHFERKEHAISAGYGTWAVLKMLVCTYTDVYDFDVCFQKLGENYDMAPFPIIGSYSTILMSSWASLVSTSRAGAQEEYIQAMSRSIPSVSRMLKGCLYGFDDLAKGELCFYRYEFESAEQHLNNAIEKALDKEQFTTHNKALGYMMQIAFAKGDYRSAELTLNEMETLLSERDYGARYKIFDFAVGFYHLALDEPESVPEWLKGKFSAYAHPIFMEYFGNRVKALYQYHARQYRTLLSFIDSERNKEMVLFGKIEMKILEALSQYKLKQHRDAFCALAEAYELAEPNKIIAPFVLHSKDMRTLTAVAVKNDESSIPKSWLADINRKSSAYAKRKAKMMSEYRMANQDIDDVSLSVRETAIMKDLALGLSRTEIASTQNISLSTVKREINGIYDKFGVSNLAAAISVAKDRNLI